MTNSLVSAAAIPAADSFYALMSTISTAQGTAARWQVARDPDAPQLWILAHPQGVQTPDQGWKLHVSAIASEAAEVLRRILPVLFAADARFKVLASATQLAVLNTGGLGLAQIGKFVTIYPNSDGQAVTLGAALDQVTQGLLGPVIASDRPLRTGSLVHYRYGGFVDQLTQTPLGEIIPTIRTPSGSRVPDRRQTSYRTPQGVADPFLAAGVATPPPPPQVLIGERYLIVETRYHSPRGLIHLAVDTTNGQRCIVKHARPRTLIDQDGRDSRDHVRHEATVLERLAPDARFPQPLALFDINDEVFLVMEEWLGETLERHIAQITAQGTLIPGAQLVQWGQELAAILDTIHRKGFIYQDLKSSNVMVAPDGRLGLLDFDLAHPLTQLDYTPQAATRGYSSPQQLAGRPPLPSDDVYSLGAVLYFIATRAEPSMAPRADRLLDRPVAVLNPRLSRAVVAVITRCLDPDPAQRFAQPAAVGAALAAITTPEAEPPMFGTAPPQTFSPVHYQTLAQRLGDTICHVARVRAPGQTWLSTHSIGNGVALRDINTGVAGTLLALSALVSAFADPAHRAMLAAGAAWLAQAPPMSSDPLPGLYVGEAGIGTALLRAGQALGDTTLIAAAVQRGRQVAGYPYRAPDLFNGTAGRLRFHLWLWAATGDAAQYQAAQQAGEALLAAATPVGEDGLEWLIPPGYGSLSGNAYLGYAHGTAGIADALLDLAATTEDPRFQAAAHAAARRLAALAVPVLADASGLNWPNVAGSSLAHPFWCHGATGIGRFFLHAAQRECWPDAAALAAGAARTVARGARWIGPTQCHGLAGNIEFLLDMAQQTGDASYRAEAAILAQLLEAFAQEHGGQLVWPAERTGLFTPDFMVGYAGVVACLLRLGAPDGESSFLNQRISADVARSAPT